MPTDLTPAELDAIEARQARCYIYDRPGDVVVSPEEDAYALLSSLRAAWEERDRGAERERVMVEQAWQEAVFQAAKLVQDTGLAMTCQTMGQYRTLLITRLAGLEAPALTPPGEGATDG